MKIVTAKWLFDGETVQNDCAVAFDEKIVALGTPEKLKAQYPKAEFLELDNRTVLMPGLVNPHVHLEFGANTTHLKFGDFMQWLDSVIARRDELTDACKAGCYKRQIDTMLASGITTFGAVSSYGKEMLACKAAPQRVIFFNEAIGSQPAAVDTLYADFKTRLEESRSMASERFIPAVAIHSPYSVHPVLIKKILKNFGDLPLSAHFMESPAEKAWLERGEGPFKPFFENFLKQTAPLCFPEEFLQLLKGKRALLTHAVHADEKQLRMIAEEGHAITHCPRSNRLLGCGRIKLEKLEELQIPWLLGTDGLSSNTSLNLWDEMRAAVMMHCDTKMESISLNLLKAATSRAADALNLPIGRLKKGNWADLIVAPLPDDPKSPGQLPLQLILHTERIEHLYIQGEKYV